MTLLVSRASLYLHGSLNYVWSDSEGGAAGILEELREGIEGLYRFEKMLEAQ
jgi:hypothetical protein